MQNKLRALPCALVPQPVQNQTGTLSGAVLSSRIILPAAIARAHRMQLIVRAFVCELL